MTDANLAREGTRMNHPLHLAVLLSGAGTTLQNLIGRIANGRPAARMVQALASHPEASALHRATRAGLPAAVVERRGCPSAREFSQRIFDLCQNANADLV